MTKLSKEAWDALSTEEQQVRQEERPEEPGSAQPTAEELSQQIADLSTKLKKLEDERGGLIGDLTAERQTRQQLAAKVKELEETGGGDKGGFNLDKMADDDYLTAGQVKQIINQLQTKGSKEAQAEEEQLSKENYNTDEERMIGLTVKPTEDYPVPYNEAIEEFNKMVKKSPAYWAAVNVESRRKNGKPAEVAYKIALTSKTFINKIKTSAREDLIDELQKQGKIPKKLPSGGPADGGEIDPSLLTEQQLLEMPESQLEGLLKKTG